MPEPPLHIAVDGRELVGQPTGVGRYVWHVLREWTATNQVPHRITVVLPRPPAAELRQAFPGVAWLVEPGRGGTAWEQVRLPRVLRRIGADVFFAVGYTAPLWRVCPFVVVTHDVSFIAHPEWFHWREGLRRRWLTAAAARTASAVLTVSEFSASEIERCVGVRRDRMQLAPPGGPAVATLPARPREPLVLFVGSIFNRRRVPTLIEAFAVVSTTVPEARLVIVGDNRTAPALDLLKIAKAHGVAQRVEWRQYVRDDELTALYSAASVFAFLSEYEGFAMTPMEAIAHGVPAVMLDTPVAREIYADGAHLVPDDVGLIAAAIASLLTDSEAHDAALAAGLDRIRHYSWTRTAAVALAALEQAARS